MRVTMTVVFTGAMSHMLALLAIAIALFSSVSDASILRGGENGEKIEKVPPVKVKVLEEALCPGCHQFMQEDLAPAYEKLGATVIDLQVVPFGNAEYVPKKDGSKNLVLKCQHGEAECDANSFEQCVALMLYPYAPRYLPFLQCLNEQLPTGYSDKDLDRNIYSGCAKQAALDWESIVACHDSKDTAKAMQQVANALTPDHEYVPWIEINGKHVELKNDEDFFKAVCKAYTESGGSNPHCSDIVGVGAKKTDSGETFFSKCENLQGSAVA